MSKLVDLTGQRFGKLTVIKKVPKPINLKKEAAYWLCKCDCGNEKIFISSSLIEYIGKNGKSTKSRSCGCATNEYRKEYTKKYIEKFGNPAENRVWTAYKTIAKKRNLEITITKEEFLNMVKKICFYCGEEPKNISYNEAKTMKFLYNGIDRIDNNKGYILENCVPCCDQCNKAKRTISLDEFKNWIIRIYNNFILNKNEELNKVRKSFVANNFLIERNKI